MPHEFSKASYKLIQNLKHIRPTGDLTSPELPKPDMSKPGSLAPKYLLQHENKFDPNVYTPEQMMDKSGSFSGMRSKEPISKA